MFGRVLWGLRLCYIYLFIFNVSHSSLSLENSLVNDYDHFNPRTSLQCLTDTNPRQSLRRSFETPSKYLFEVPFHLLFMSEKPLDSILLGVT